MVPLVDVFKFNLILRQCERDNKAFETLFDFYYPRIKLHIHKKFPDACADDVAQEFFLQLMKSHGFKYVQNPTAWVFACCDNIAKRMLIGESATLPLLVSENYSVSEDLVETEILNDQAKRVFAAVFFAATLFAMLYVGGVAEAFTQEELDECDRLFVEAVGETIDQNGETGSFAANKRMIYDVALHELGFVYSYTNAQGDGYAVILVLEQPVVSEIVEGKDPYANLQGLPIYVNQFTYAGYRDGEYTFANGVVMTKEEVDCLNGVRGVGDLTQSESVVNYVSKTDNKQTAIKNHPGYYQPESSLPSGCTAVAAANVIGYYDRLVPDLIPDYDAAITIGTTYTYKSQNSTIVSLMTNLYTFIGVNATTGATVSKFKYGLRGYCASTGTNVTFAGVMSGSTLDYGKAAQIFLAEKPVVLFVQGFQFATINSEENADTYKTYTGNGSHAVVAFELREIVYTLANGSTTTNRLVKIATGYRDVAKAYLNLSSTAISDAFVVNIM